MWLARLEINLVVELNLPGPIGYTAVSSTDGCLQTQQAEALTLYSHLTDFTPVRYIYYVCILYFTDGCNYNAAQFMHHTRKVSKLTRPSLPFRFIRERGIGY